MLRKSTGTPQLNEPNPRSDQNSQTVYKKEIAGVLCSKTAQVWLQWALMRHNCLGLCCHSLSNQDTSKTKTFGEFWLWQLLGFIHLCLYVALPEMEHLNLSERPRTWLCEIGPGPTHRLPLLVTSAAGRISWNCQTKLSFWEMFFEHPRCIESLKMYRTGTLAYKCYICVWLVMPCVL